MPRPPSINTSQSPGISPLTTGEANLPTPETPSPPGEVGAQAQQTPPRRKKSNKSRRAEAEEPPKSPPRRESPVPPQDSPRPDLPRRPNATKGRKNTSKSGGKARRSAPAEAAAAKYESKEAIQAARDRNARVSTWESFKSGCSAALQWSGWRLLCAFSTYATAGTVPILMLVLATSGSELVPSQWRFYFTSKDGVRLGAWGWQEPSGQASFGIIYTIPSQPWSSDLSSSAAILSALLLASGAAGLVFLTSFALLALRLLLIHAQCCTDATICCSVACARCYDAERLETNRRSGRAGRSVPGLERWWFEVTMWWMMFTVWILAAALLVWDSQAGSDGLVGMAILTASLILASKWLLLRWLYRSSWSGVSMKSKLRAKRKSVRDRVRSKRKG